MHGSLAAHAQSAHALVNSLLAGQFLCAMVACVVDLSIHHCFPMLAPILLCIVVCTLSTIWQVVWKRWCKLVSPIGEEDLEATQCLCDICQQAQLAGRQQVMLQVDMPLVAVHYLHECHVGAPPLLGKWSATLCPVYFPVLSMVNA